MTVKSNGDGQMGMMDMKRDVVLETQRAQETVGGPVLVRVNLASMSVECQPIHDRLRYCGGRQLTSRVVAEEVPATCDALGSHNKVVIAPGLLSHPFVPCSGRTSVGAKSPLTGGIKESNVGGTASHSLVRLGIKGLVIEGGSPPDGPFILRITPGAISVLGARDMAGLTNYEVVRRLRDEFGSHTAVMSVGPAGERQLPIATVAVTDIDGHPSRHAARGGLGAVLGSKGIKAIVLEPPRLLGDSPSGLVTSTEFRRIVKEWAVSISAAKKVMTAYGTANLVNVVNLLGGLPTRNFSSGQFEGAEAISGESLSQLIRERGGRVGHPCHPGCAIRCSNVYVDRDGTYVTSGLEYETIGLIGANCGISDLDAIAMADRRCDELGIDTMETGTTIAVAMEAGLAQFGDAGAMLRLIEEVGKGTVLGRVLGQGVSIAGRVLGVKRIPAVKGQGMSAYDPRAFKGTGVTYATSPMGADHTAGNCLPGRGGLAPENSGGLDGHQPDGQWKLSRDVQLLTTVCDVLGLCFFVGTTPKNLEKMALLLSVVSGRDWSVDDLVEAGRSTLRVERAFNCQAGIGPRQNRLPDYFRTEPLPPTGLAFDVPQEEVDRAAEF